MAQATAQIGVTGLGVMGRNLARNFARHGYTVALHNRTTSRTTAMVDQFGHEGNFVPAQTAEEFVQALERPRRLVIMVNAGPATDAVIDEFAPLLEDGDMIIDGGNAHFDDTRRREAKLREQNLHFVGMGVSGGEEGALNGPSIMPGGSQESYASLGPMLETISAHVDGTPCCTHIGPDGAGHFVKMVHNGIEYADMQLIAEAYDLLRHGVGMTPAQIAETFRTWNTGRLDSYLIEITAEVLAHTDASTDKPFVDIVLDQAEQKGTGRWTVQDALDLGVPVSGIAEAVFARSLSGHADLRRAARGLPGPSDHARRGRRVRRPDRAGPVRVQAGLLRAGLAHDGRRQPGVRLGPRPRPDRRHLARRLHHQGRVPRPHPRRLREQRRAAHAAGRRGVRQGPRRRPGRLAQRGRHRGPARHPGARLLRRPGLLRRAAGRTPARRPGPGPARLLRRAHVPPYGPRRHVPYAVGPGPFGGIPLVTFVPNGPGSCPADGQLPSPMTLTALVKDSSSLVVSPVPPGARISTSVFTGPVPCAIQTVTSTVCPCAVMVVFTTLAR